MDSRSTDALRDANLERSRRKRAAVVEALRTFEEEGWPITKSAIAQKSGVSMWLLRRPELSSEVDDAIMRQSILHSALNGASETTSLASFRAQLSNALEQNRKLQLRNDRLKAALDTKTLLDPERQGPMPEITKGLPDERFIELRQENAALNDLVQHLRGELADRVEEVQALRSRLARPHLVLLRESQDDHKD